MAIGNDYSDYVNYVTRRKNDRVRELKSYCKIKPVKHAGREFSVGVRMHQDSGDSGEEALPRIRIRATRESSLFFKGSP